MVEVKEGRILVVERDARMRASRARILRDAGHTVSEAWHLADAALLRQTQPELLVLDGALNDRPTGELHGAMVLRISPARPASAPATSSAAASASGSASGTSSGSGQRDWTGRAEADAWLAEPVAEDVLISTANALLRLGRAERALRDSAALAKSARQEAHDATRIKDDFLGSISHELRTPLHAIVGWIALLRSRAFDDEARAKAFEVIDRNARVETKLIEDLLDISHIALGQLHLTWVTVELAPIVCSALDAIAPTAEAKGVTISTDIALDPDIIVRGDPMRLRQVFWNLLSNAVKFTPEGGRVDVHAHAAKGHAKIDVTDSGRGISPDVLPRVFDRFSRANRGTTSPDRGLGLGLAIAREVAELHGGTVTATSAGLGKGAKFAVTLPYHTTVPEGTAAARAAGSTRRV